MSIIFPSGALISRDDGASRSPIGSNQERRATHTRREQFDMAFRFNS
ncbi:MULTISPECIES: hypothetical protein [Burkholderia]|nr:MULTISPECIES: hypothetical protein [Burkholderia]EKS9796469.1 hypothetical protein [Burkholderia cepacia]EKS9803295.1 hypothetical protein [Burkholderia cepacia]EKS9812899.1 hypothetical protein [Burkholderia cepacia]EKS9823383.1 hypothetical protein [Burkholderia cepacia]EKS9825064.1 hypothetical protein [Burkholderia cepacia]